MTQFVQVLEGMYRGQSCAGKVFELVEGFHTTGKGPGITVVNGGNFPRFPDQIRIRLQSTASYKFVTEDSMESTVVEEVVPETDDQIIDRIRERFEVLDMMSQAACDADIRGLIVAGPPGVGKTYGVEQQFEKHNLFPLTSGKAVRAEVVKGSASAVNLYMKLYEYRDQGCVVAFDDCDDVLLDDSSLNILKAALDSSKKRTISWLYESNALRNADVPNSFVFEGSVIFITNLKLANLKGKIKEHLAALQSRCHYLDLTMDTPRERILRLKQIAADGLFDGYSFSQAKKDQIVDFMVDNQGSLNELSLRMAIKLADLSKAFPNDWERTARITCCK